MLLIYFLNVQSTSPGSSGVMTNILFFGLPDLRVRCPTRGSTGPTSVFTCFEYSCLSHLGLLLQAALPRLVHGRWGPSAALCRALMHLQSETPALGILSINAKSSVPTHLTCFPPARCVLISQIW